MLSNGDNQSLICSSQSVRSTKTCNFGEDDDVSGTRFSARREDELKGFLSQFPHEKRSEFDRWIRILVKEETELSHKIQAEAISHRSNNFVLRNLELTISNLSSPLLTGDHIKGTDGMPVTVTLIDSCTKEEVKSGPEASGKVEIVVIEAETEDGGNDFEGKLVCHMEGKKSVHVNYLPLKLLKGTAVFPRVSFARNKRWMRISTLRLQARFVDNFDGIHIKEAQTEPFLLKDRRNKAYKKHPIPSLNDEVWRLYNIDRKKTLAQTLIEKDIKTVEDFIVCLFLDPRRLKEEFVKTLVVSAFKNWRNVIRISEDQFVARCIHSLDRNMLHDEHEPDPQFLPEILSTRYDEIYHGFKGLCTSIRLERVKNGSCKRWRKLFCVVTFTTSFDYFHAHKKRRFS